MSEELHQQCVSIFKFIRDVYGKEINKSVLFKEFNIGENNKEKIFKYLEKNGIKFVKASKKEEPPLKKSGIGLGQSQKKATISGDFGYSYGEDEFGDYGFKQTVRRTATISNPASEIPLSNESVSAKVTQKSLADSLIQKTAKQIKKQNDAQRLVNSAKQSLGSGYYGKVRKQF